MSAVLYTSYANFYIKQMYMHMRSKRANAVIASVIFAFEELLSG